MPYKPKHPCGHPGCPELVESGKQYCAKHPTAPFVTGRKLAEAVNLLNDPAAVIRASGRGQAKRTFGNTHARYDGFLPIKHLYMSDSANRCDSIRFIICKYKQRFHDGKAESKRDHGQTGGGIEGAF